jgi:hypothetical protein
MELYTNVSEALNASIIFPDDGDREGLCNIGV